MTLFRILLVIIVLSFLAFKSNAQDRALTLAKPTGHAPISVMGDHLHSKGEIMLSYRYMPMWMDGNISGVDKVSDDDVFENFMISPQKMTMDMHMLGVMYAPTDRITLMLMGNVIANSMDLLTGTGINFTTQSSGLGDMAMTSLIGISKNEKSSFHGILGVSIPTGDIDQRDATPMNENAQLAYPMQLGSATWDPFIGLNYTKENNHFKWGAQSTYKYRISSNSENYTLGNNLNAVAWIARNITPAISLSTSLSFYDNQSINGKDADLNPLMMPLFDTMNSGRTQLDLGLGTNVLIRKGVLKGLRLAGELKLPTYQSVNGIQMKNSAYATFGLQYAI